MIEKILEWGSEIEPLPAPFLELGASAPFFISKYEFKYSTFLNINHKITT